MGRRKALTNVSKMLDSLVQKLLSFETPSLAKHAPLRDARGFNYQYLFNQSEDYRLQIDWSVGGEGVG